MDTPSIVTQSMLPIDVACGIPVVPACVLPAKEEGKIQAEIVRVVPVDESRRVAAVEELGILDTAPEAAFDEAVRLAAFICGTPMSLVVFIDARRQWFKARLGVDVKETPKEGGFCTHTITQPGIYVVADASLDPMFQDHPLVANPPGIRFYAGVPLRNRKGLSLGTICVMDVVPRQLTQQQLDALTMLSRQVASQLELRVQMNILARVVQDKERVEQQLRSSNARFEAFMDNSPLVGYMKNEQGQMLYYNRPFAERFQITREEWLGKDDHELWPAEFAAEFRANDLAVIAGGRLVVSDETTPGFDGKDTYWRSYKFPFVNAAGEHLVAGMSLDISLEKEAEHALLQSHEELHRANERLREMSVTDALTGLCNRRGFDERLLQELATASRHGFNFSMLMIDVDDFKAHNDSFGHDAGDKVLRQIAGLLRQCIRLSDVACRYGGEEFAVLLPNTNLTHALMLANRLRRSIEGAAWELGRISVSVGVGTSPHGRLNAAELIHATDAAMYEAKAQGKNRVVAAR